MDGAGGLSHINKTQVVVNQNFPSPTCSVSCGNLAGTFRIDVYVILDEMSSTKDILPTKATSRLNYFRTSTWVSFMHCYAIRSGRCNLISRFLTAEVYTPKEARLYLIVVATSKLKVYR